MGEFDACEGNIRSTSSHSPDDFTDSCSVIYLHFFRELLLDLGIIGSCGGVERFDPSWRGWKWSRFIFGKWHIPEPGVDVLLAEFVDVRVAVDFDVVFRLDDVHAVEHIEEALSFQWYTQHVVDGVK